MLSAPSFLLPTDTSMGLFMYVFEILTISCGMVAEKSRVCFSFGVVSRIPSSSSLKPMVSISSASSRTKKRILLTSSFLRLIKSSDLPGVPTTIWAPRCNSATWPTMLAPPYTATIFILSEFLAYDFRSLAICMQSSRVGLKISAWVSFDSVIFWIMGSPKAAVFPVPVCARPMRSFSFSSRIGMVFSWIGVGVSNPNFSIAWSISSDNPSDLKVVINFCVHEKHTLAGNCNCSMPEISD